MAAADDLETLCLELMSQTTEAEPEDGDDGAVEVHESVEDLTRLLAKQLRALPAGTLQPQASSSNNTKGSDTGSAGHHQVLEGDDSGLLSVFEAMRPTVDMMLQELGEQGSLREAGALGGNRGGGGGSVEEAMQALMRDLGAGGDMFDDFQVVVGLKSQNVGQGCGGGHPAESEKVGTVDVGIKSSAADDEARMLKCIDHRGDSEVLKVDFAPSKEAIEEMQADLRETMGFGGFEGLKVVEVGTRNGEGGQEAIQAMLKELRETALGELEGLDVVEVGTKNGEGGKEAIQSMLKELRKL